MKELIILTGNIGSGKSTLVKKFQSNNFVVIARDMLRYSIGGGIYTYNLEYESIIWDIELELFYRFLELDVNIIIDEVGVSKEMRSRYIYNAREYDYKITSIVLPRLSMKESVDRRMINPHGQDDRKLWESVWTKFDNMYEEPTKDEGFDEIIFYNSEK